MQTTGVRNIAPLNIIQVLVIMLAAPAATSAQLQVSGQVSGAYVRSAQDVSSQYVFNDGRGSFTARLDLSGDAVLSDNISFHSAVRILQDQVVHIDQMALELQDVTPLHLAIQAGEIDLPFGSLEDQRYPMKNPFFHLPLMNEHLTSIRSSDNQLWPFDPQYTRAGNGVRLLDQGLYDVGMKISASFGIVDLAAALVNGSVAMSSTYSGGGISMGAGLGVVVRCSVTPDPAWTAGVSYAHGYLSGAGYSYGYTISPEITSFPVHSFEGDISFSAGHLILSAEGLYSRWDLTYRYHSNFDAAAYSVDAQYAFLPRWSAAVRAGGIVFKPVHILLPGPDYIPAPFDGPWDNSLIRMEGSLSYRIDRPVLIKLVYEWTSTTQTSPRIVVPAVAVQTVLTF